MFKRILSIILLIAVSLCFAGCQTMEGIGGDLKWTGEQVEAGAANCTVPPPDESKPK
jgi:predicted small secreted protein